MADLVVCRAAGSRSILFEKLKARWDSDFRAWVVELSKEKEAEKMVAEVNHIRRAWPGNSAEWWIGLEDTFEAKVFSAKLANDVLAGDVTPPVPPPDDLERWRALVKDHQWQFAKTMPKCPHWYTLRKQWKVEGEFEWFVAFIRGFGVVETYAGMRHVYFYDGDFKYWTMGAPLAVTILVNRAKSVPPEPKQKSLFDEK